MFEHQYGALQQQLWKHLQQSDQPDYLPETEDEKKRLEGYVAFLEDIQDKRDENGR